MSSVPRSLLEESGNADLLRSLLDALPVLACYVDRDLVYRFVNRGYEEWFDLDASVIVGKPVEEVLGPDAFEVVQPQLHRVLSGERFAVEQWMPYSRGGRRYVEITFEPRFDQQDQVEGFFALIQDHTRRRETDRRLERSEREFRSFFENSNCGKAKLDYQTGRLLVVNGRLCEMTGYSRNELLEMQAAQLVHPDQRKSFEQTSRQNVEQGTDRWSMERLLATKSGEPLPVMINETVMRDRHGEPFQLISTILDLSEVKQAERDRLESEERFRTMADNIAQFAWMADGTGWIYWYNQRWFDYTGTTFEEMQGWGWQKVHHPDHVERVVEKISWHFQEGEPWEDTFPLRSKDGEYRWFLSRAKPIYDAAGNVVQWFGTNTDITDRLEMEHRLKELDRRKDEFLAMLGHELRNPLAAVVGGLQLVQQTASPVGPDDETFDVIYRQSQLMNRLVDDLLDVSRITRSKIQLKKQVADLTDLVTQAFEVGKAVAKQAGVACELANSDEPIYARVDTARVLQVIGNLITNAIKFTPAEGRFRVGLQLSECATSAVISVEDSGVGMDEATLAAVFDPFAQADTSLDRSRGGLGLGLPIAKGLAELHGGSLTATSDGLGAGSRFVLQLPVCEPRADEINKSSEQDLQADNSQERPLKIVIIDDRRDSRFPVERFLAGEGHQVHAASDGLEGIELVQRLHPDLVVCDIGLPNMDGYEVARTLRADDGMKAVKLFALTGYGQLEDRERALAAGFDAHLVKPIDLNELQQTIARAFAN
ncbi:PAS domain S-box protein [Aeoliella sp.]|uniref:hybrid sensor histidine kinase/response regulator n=1 Tax=Aeoliella sp. TaxID=2795800 RepID=UPI003CCBC88F